MHIGRVGTVRSSLDGFFQTGHDTDKVAQVKAAFALGKVRVLLQLAADPVQRQSFVVPRFGFFVLLVLLQTGSLGQQLAELILELQSRLVFRVQRDDLAGPRLDVGSFVAELAVGLDQLVQQLGPVQSLNGSQVPAHPHDRFLGADEFHQMLHVLFGAARAVAGAGDQLAFRVQDENGRIPLHLELIAELFVLSLQVVRQCFRPRKIQLDQNEFLRSLLLEFLLIEDLLLELDAPAAPVRAGKVHE